MAETVSSEFTPHLKRNVIIASVIIWPLIIYLVYSYFSDQARITTSDIFIGLAGIGIFGYLYYNGIVSMFLEITAAPEGLIFYYLITNKKIVIDYAEIKHVESDIILDWMAKSRRQIPATMERGGSDRLKLKIYLTSGAIFTFKSDSYTNYDELKEAIRRHRFNLP